MKNQAELILVLNCGSSSIKFALFGAGAGAAAASPPKERSEKVRGHDSPQEAYHYTASTPEENRDRE
ncbi:acetate kinase, partial [Janthinobacterium sp. CG_23.3]